MLNKVTKEALEKFNDFSMSCLMLSFAFCAPALVVMALLVVLGRLGII